MGQSQCRQRRKNMVWTRSFLSACVLWLHGTAAADQAYAAASETTLRVAASFLGAEQGNPYQTYPATLPIQALFDTLTHVDEVGNVEPWLANSWSSTNAHEWTFELRQDVTFSNGEAFNAEAVTATLGFLQSRDGKSTTIARNLEDIIEAEAVSDFTVRVTLKRPDPLFPYRASNWRIPAPAYSAALESGEHTHQPTGSGPFKVTEWTSNTITFAAFENSWRSPKLQALEFVLVPDQVARRQALVSGTFDIAVGMGPSDQAELEKVGAALHRRPAANLTFIAFALERYPDSPLKDVRVRQALNYAVNRRQIVDVLLGGHPRLVAQLALPAAPGYAAELAPYPYDPERAKALLKEAGYEGGFSVTLAASAPEADETIVYQQIASDLAAVGVDASINLYPLLQTTKMLFSGEVKGELFASLVRPIDTIEDYRFRSCLGLTGANKPLFCDPLLMPLLERARAATSLDDLSAVMNKVMKHEHYNPPGIFLWEGLEFDGLAARVRNYETGFDFIHFDVISLADDK